MTSKYRFGSHVSCSGGLVQGLNRAVESGCDCVQVFVSNPRQWPSATSLIPVEIPAKGTKPSAATTSANPSEPDSLKQFVSAWSQSGIGPAIAHTSYLINVASPDDGLWQKSLDALIVEWRRADQLQLEGLVMHPGACMKSSTEEGLARVVAAIDQATAKLRPKHCRLLFENTAGQGTCLGHAIEHLGWLLKSVAEPQPRRSLLGHLPRTRRGIRLSNRSGNEVDGTRTGTACRT